MSDRANYALATAFLLGITKREIRTSVLIALQGRPPIGNGDMQNANIGDDRSSKLQQATTGQYRTLHSQDERRGTYCKVRIVRRSTYSVRTKEGRH